MIASSGASRPGRTASWIAIAVSASRQMAALLMKVDRDSWRGDCDAVAATPGPDAQQPNDRRC